MTAAPGVRRRKTALRRGLAASAAFVAALSVTASTQAPSANFKLANGLGMWNTTTGDVDGDGEDELIVATLDGGKVTELTFKTPLYILSVIGDKVVDRSPELFDTPPTSWNTTLTTGDFDGDGRLDLLLCDRGRNVGPNPPPAGVLIDGVRGAQNEVLLNRDGKLRIAEGFPRMVTSSWGCSAGDVDGSGRATIALMSWYPRGHDAAFTLTWDGVSRFIQTRTLLQAPIGGVGWGATATADFDGNGFADVSGGRQVFWNGPGPLTGSQPLAQSTVEREGYTFWRTTLVADFTGDGLPDLIKFNCFPEPSLAEGRLAMYTGDRRLGLVEKVDAFPASPENVRAIGTPHHFWYIAHRHVSVQPLLPGIHVSAPFHGDTRRMSQFTGCVAAVTPRKQQLLALRDDGRYSQPRVKVRLTAPAGRRGGDGELETEISRKLGGVPRTHIVRAELRHRIGKLTPWITRWRTRVIHSSCKTLNGAWNNPDGAERRVVNKFEVDGVGQELPGHLIGARGEPRIFIRCGQGGAQIVVGLIEERKREAGARRRQGVIANKELKRIVCPGTRLCRLGCGTAERHGGRRTGGRIRSGWASVAPAITTTTTATTTASAGDGRKGHRCQDQPPHHRPDSVQAALRVAGRHR